MHISVLLNEVIEFLSLKDGDIIFDGTLGGGGHAEEILKRISPNGRLIGVDKDSAAIERVKKKLSKFKENLILENDDFRNVDEILKKIGIKSINGAIFDLGMSSYQVDDKERGFSFLHDGPLDMRFDREQKMSARYIVNTFSKSELTDIIRTFGEERYSGQIAGAICAARQKKAINTTSELAGVIKRSVGGKYRKQRINPAARTFQALRIYVNDELGSLEAVIGKTVQCLAPGAKICLISFHSLEDRIVKRAFRALAKEGLLTIITKKPLISGRDEIKDNPRARSAKLRVAEKKNEIS
ncbi:MAG: 16S rRNA (cytosine(1402)-N(4))-methyltransferase RsmH [Candidatus Omnitrophota bacterium]